MKPVTALSLLLDKRKPKPMNILIGSEGSVIRALEKKFNTSITKFDPEVPAVFSYLELELDLPLGVRESAAVWDNPVISGNQGTFHYLIGALVPTLPKGDAEELARTLSHELTGIRDFKVLYWTVLDRATNYTKKVWGKKPWEDPTTWISDDLTSNLNWVMQEVRAYTYAVDENKKELASLGISTKKATFLKSKKYSNILMYDTLVQLSKWKAGKYDEFQTAAILSSIWSRE